MNENDFLKSQQDAIARMREINSRSVYNTPHKMPPVPSFVKTQNTSRQQNPNNPPKTPPKTEAKANLTENSILPKGTFGFLDKIITDTDTTLIIGLLLILLSEKADKKLLFALIYILL